ncbi:MAG: hypothetical protein AAF585_11120 [Verrucomicrobiota bacterium]
MLTRFQTWIALAIVFLRTRRLRRTTMFWLAIVVMVQVTLGGWFIDKALESRPVIFVTYWFLCFGLVMFLLLLATYDLLVTPREMRAEANLDKSLKDEDRD